MKDERRLSTSGPAPPSKSTLTRREEDDEKEVALHPDAARSDVAV